MHDIEKHSPQLAGVLPKTYNLFTSTLIKELLKKLSEMPATVDYDAFGRICEYFLGQVARTEDHKGGEFYTPSCVVRLLTEVVEPYLGRILDPACGSGGMFVSSAHFVPEHKQHTTAELGRLCRMNLAVHGLEGDIRHGCQVNSNCEDPHDACLSSPSRRGARGEGAQDGRFDFILANPQFNDSEWLCTDDGCYVSISRSNVGDGRDRVSNSPPPAEGQCQTRLRALRSDDFVDLGRSHCPKPGAITVISKASAS